MFSFPLDVDFNQRITVYFFYQAIDIISSLGGISAASDPIFLIITPLIILYYIY